MYQVLCWMLRIHWRIEYSPCLQESLQLVIYSDILVIYNKKGKEYIQKLWLVDLNSKNFLCIIWWGDWIKRERVANPQKTLACYDSITPSEFHLTSGSCSPVAKCFALRYCR